MIFSFFSLNNIQNPSLARYIQGEIFFYEMQQNQFFGIINLIDCTLMTCQTRNMVLNGTESTAIQNLLEIEDHQVFIGDWDGIKQPSHQIKKPRLRHSLNQKVNNNPLNMTRRVRGRYFKQFKQQRVSLGETMMNPEQKLRDSAEYENALMAQEWQKNEQDDQYWMGKVKWTKQASSHQQTNFYKSKDNKRYSSHLVMPVRRQDDSQDINRNRQYRDNLMKSLANGFSELQKNKKQLYDQRKGSLGISQNPYTLRSFFSNNFDEKNRSMDTSLQKTMRQTLNKLYLKNNVKNRQQVEARYNKQQKGVMVRQLLYNLQNLKGNKQCQMVRHHSHQIASLKIKFLTKNNHKNKEEAVKILNLNQQVQEGHIKRRFKRNL